MAASHGYRGTFPGTQAPLRRLYACERGLNAALVDAAVAVIPTALAVEAAARAVGYSASRVR